MGTRNLTAVVKGGEYLISQYGQWDGYPDGAGITALNFLRDPGNVARLREKVSTHTRPATDHDKRTVPLPPSISRDTGARILSVVANANEPVPIYQMIEFAGDSLFCEWAWVVDLDKNTFEAFVGFNKQPLGPGERFAWVPREKETYYPVRHVATWPLDALPDEATFLAAFDDLKDGD